MRKGAIYPLIYKDFDIPNDNNYEILPLSHKPYYIAAIHVCNDSDAPINLKSGGSCLGIIPGNKELYLTFPVNVTDLFGLELSDLSFCLIDGGEGIVSVTIYSLNRGS